MRALRERAGRAGCRAAVARAGDRGGRASGNRDRAILKVTLPVGLVPVTVAVNVTASPTTDGLSELPTVVVVGAGPLAALTPCDSAALVDARLPASPPYTAVMLCVPCVSALVEQVAVRLLPAPVTAAVEQPAIETAPSRKFTVPVGLVPLTVAVNVTEAPTVDGLSELPSAVVVGPGPPPPLITWESGALVDGALPVLPLYSAVTLCVPAASALVAHVAVRLPPKPPTITGCAAQPVIDVPPSLKLTEPVGAVPLTVATNMTGTHRGRIGLLARVVALGSGTLPTADATAAPALTMPARRRAVVQLRSLACGIELHAVPVVGNTRAR